MRRRQFITLFGVATAAWPLAAGAQQEEKVYKIGVLTAGSSEPGGKSIVVEALRELGYVEGKNLTFERKYAEDRLDRLPALAAELVSLKVDVIMAAGTLAPLAAKKATSTIPIVMMDAGDPVGSGLVASLAEPGGNVTGMSLMAPDLGRTVSCGSSARTVRAPTRTASASARMRWLCKRSASPVIQRDSPFLVAIRPSRLCPIPDSKIHRTLSPARLRWDRRGNLATTSASLRYWKAFPASAGGGRSCSRRRPEPH
jgi:hypothetical protein